MKLRLAMKIAKQSMMLEGRKYPGHLRLATMHRLLHTARPYKKGGK